jgi:hypothetical protein
MAFLDNSGDIILDAVLTDHGRKLLANGGFRISKFAFGDEEINYALFNGAHPSGSSYHDLEILQTPILEAFTSDQSLMKTRLLSLSRRNVLFMPILKINGSDALAKIDTTIGGSGGYTILADEKTFSDNRSPAADEPSGFIRGVSGKFGNITTHICVDQGIDSSKQNNFTEMDIDLIETSFMVKVDHRLLTIEQYLGQSNTEAAHLSNIDDDDIATYMFTSNSGAIKGPREPNFRDRSDLSDSSNENTSAGDLEVFAGALGNVLRFTPRVTTSVQQAFTYFDEIGESKTGLNYRGDTLGASNSYKQIDTVISVTGVTTGYSIDIPVRILKGIY